MEPPVLGTANHHRLEDNHSNSMIRYLTSLPPLSSMDELKATRKVISLFEEAEVNLGYRSRDEDKLEYVMNILGIVHNSNGGDKSSARNTTTSDHQRLPFSPIMNQNHYNNHSRRSGDITKSSYWAAKIGVKDPSYACEDRYSSHSRVPLRFKSPHYARYISPLKR